MRFVHDTHVWEARVEREEAGWLVTILSGGRQPQATYRFSRDIDQQIAVDNAIQRFKSEHDQFGKEPPRSAGGR